MSRLQKKCLAVSVGIHLLLLGILFVGPAFLAGKKDPAPDLEILDFIPLKTVDALVAPGGGDPRAGAPASLSAPPQPQPPAPVPEPVKPAPEPIKPAPEPIQPAPDPEPPKPVAKPAVKPPSDSLEASPKPRGPQISTTIVTRDNTREEARVRAAAEARERERALEARRRLAKEFGSAAASLGNSLSDGVSVKIEGFRGPGGGGIPYANFLQAVKSVYANAWVLPDGITDDTATTIVSVTIARDGRVVSSRITRRSGNGAVDASVQATLNRVRRAAPLPDDSTEATRTVTINFNVRAKQALG